MCDHYIIYVYRQLPETCVVSQHGVPSIPRHGWSSCSAWNSGINPSCFNVPHHFFGAQSSFFLAIWLCIKTLELQNLVLFSSKITGIHGCSCLKIWHTVDKKIKPGRLLPPLEFKLHKAADSQGPEGWLFLAPANNAHFDSNYLSWAVF